MKLRSRSHSQSWMAPSICVTPTIVDGSVLLTNWGTWFNASHMSSMFKKVSSFSFSSLSDICIQKFKGKLLFCETTHCFVLRTSLLIGKSIYNSCCIVLSPSHVFVFLKLFLEEASKVFAVPGVDDFVDGRFVDPTIRHLDTLQWTLQISR